MMMQLLQLKYGISVCLIFFYGQVHGCRNGFYGVNCTKPCPPNCKTDTCSRSGLCADCTPRLYGIRCNHACPTTCIHSECYRYNVSCTRGCKQGWYGKKCEQQCAGCAGDCHRDTGRCSSHSSSESTQLKSAPRCDQNSRLKDGCVAGCQGGNCDTPCPDSCLQCHRYKKYCTSCPAEKYGEQCDEPCPRSCSRTCDMYGDCVNTYVKGIMVSMDGTDPGTKNHVSYDTDHTGTIITIAAVLSAFLLTTAVAAVIYQYALKSHDSKQPDDTEILCNNTDYAVLIHTSTTSDSSVSSDTVAPGMQKATNIIPETVNCVLLPVS